MARDLNESFAVEGPFLVRRVVPKRGRPYEHRCPLAAYEAVAHAIDELKGAAFVGDDLQRAEDLPWTQVVTALAFLKDRGLVEPVHGRKHAAGSDCVHLLAMTEFFALEHLGPADPSFGYAT